MVFMHMLGCLNKIYTRTQQLALVFKQYNVTCYIRSSPMSCFIKQFHKGKFQTSISNEDTSNTSPKCFTKVLQNKESEFLYLQCASCLGKFYISLEERQRQIEHSQKVCFFESTLYISSFTYYR